MKTRTVRFDKKEEEAIEEFLRQNPVFDFSTIVRIALQQFFSDPKVLLKKPKRHAKTKEAVQ